MPQGKDYIDKVYEGMTDAYGPKGGLAPGQFTLSSDDFEKKLMSNPNYVQKIYGAMDHAYGKGGVYLPDRMDIDPFTFKTNLGIKPKLPFYFGDSDQLIVPAGSTEESPKPDKPDPSPTAEDAVSQDVGGVTDFLHYIGDKAVQGMTNAAAGLVNLGVLESHVNPVMALARKAGSALYGKDLPTLGQEQSAVLSGEKATNKVLSSKNSEAIANHYDHTLAGQIVGGLVEMAPEIAAASVTGGTSFFMSAYNSGLKDAKARNMSESGTQIHALMAGAVAQAMMSIPVFHALDNKIVQKFAGDYAGRLLADAIDKNGGKKLTTAAINDILSQARTSLSSRVKLAGAKALKSGGEGILFGILGYGGDIANQKVSNAIEGKQVFVSDDFDTKDFLHNAFVGGAQMALLGGGATMLTSSTGRYIRSHIAQDASPESIARLKQGLQNTLSFSNLGESEQGIILNNIDELAGIAHQFPSDMPMQQRENVITQQADRNHLQRVNEDLKKKNEAASEAIKPDNEREIKANEDMLSFMDDRIRESYLNKKYTYHAEDTFVDYGNGNVQATKRYFKTLEGEEPKEITESQYDLATSPEAWKGYGETANTVDPQAQSDDFLQDFGVQQEANIGNNINTNENGTERKSSQGSQVGSEDQPQGQPNDSEGQKPDSGSNPASRQDQNVEEGERTLQDDLTGKEGATGSPEHENVPSLTLADEDLNNHIGEIDDRIQRQQAANYEHEQSGNEKAAAQGRIKVNADIAKRDFAEKYKMKLDDAIKTLKKVGDLTIDCKGRKFTIRKK